MLAQYLEQFQQYQPQAVQQMMNMYQQQSGDGKFQGEMGGNFGIGK